MQVLRTVFFLLVLGNLLLFAWGRAISARPAGSARPNGWLPRSNRQLRIAGKGMPTENAAAPPREDCRALAGLEPEAAGRLAELLAGRDAQLKIGQRPLDEPKSWWVHIPPLPNSAQADKKAAELSRLGIKDFYVVREGGPNQYAISLGLYKSEESANNYLNALLKKGVKSARIQVREAPGDKSVVEIRGTPQQLVNALAELPPEFSGVSRADCAAARP
ncbi:MAG: SPOR domain-containing protein [Rhodocyclales bacterium]|nr:SPOR domain-containing protein [Rhodocyclales bacterium]